MNKKDTLSDRNKLTAKGKWSRRLGVPLLIFLFTILSLLFIPHENAYAKNETVYTYTSGYCTLDTYVDGVWASNYRLNATYWGDMDGVGDYTWLKYTGEMYVMVNDGMAWLKEDLILNSGQDVIIQNGSGWGWTDSDGAEGLPFNTRQYAWWFPMKTSLRGYHLDKVTLGEGAFQAMTVAWGDDRFWLISDTNGLGITNYADGEWRHNSYNVYLAVNHYDVKYDGNGATGGSTADSKCTYNTPFNISECGYTKDHYIFAGWKDADGNSYSPGQVASNLAGAGLNNDSITLYAQWIPANYNQTLHWYYYYAGGSYDSPGHGWGYLGDKVYSQTYGTWFDASGKWNDWGNVAGYHYWCMNSDGWTVTGEGETNAHYYPNKYRVKVDLNKGKGSTEPKGTNGYFDMEYGTYINLGIPTREGYTFAGWKKIYDNSSRSSLSGNVFTMGYSNTYPYRDYTGTETVKLQAQWTTNTYTLKFDGNGADSGSVADMTVSYDSDISLPLNGYALDRNTFAGWTLDSSAHVGAYFAGQDILSSAIIDAAGMSNQNNAVITLYCAWDPAANISVKNKSFTLEEARNGLITEERLFEDAYAMDDILDKEILPGTHDLGDGRTNSFTITNYSPEEFPQFTDSGSNTITYQVIDSVGNVTEKTITVYIVNNAPQEPESGEGTYRVRFISEKYYDKPEEEGGLMKNSIWRINPEYAELLSK